MNLLLTGLVVNCVHWNRVEQNRMNHAFGRASQHNIPKIEHFTIKFMADHTQLVCWNCFQKQVARSTSALLSQFA